MLDVLAKELTLYDEKTLEKVLTVKKK